MWRLGASRPCRTHPHIPGPVCTVTSEVSWGRRGSCETKETSAFPPTLQIGIGSEYFNNLKQGPSLKLSSVRSSWECGGSRGGQARLGVWMYGIGDSNLTVCACSLFHFGRLSTLRQVGRKRDGKAFWPCIGVQHGGFVNTKTWPEPGGTRPGIVSPTPAYLVQVGI
jgi:hypothetical protein